MHWPPRDVDTSRSLLHYLLLRLASSSGLSLREELLSRELLCGEFGEVTWRIEADSPSCEAADSVQRISRDSMREAHAWAEQRVKPCTQQCYIHTSSGNFPLWCSLSLSPPLRAACCVLTITPTHCCNRFTTHKDHTSICIMFTSIQIISSHHREKSERNRQMMDTK